MVNQIHLMVSFFAQNFSLWTSMSIASIWCPIKTRSQKPQKNEMKKKTRPRLRHKLWSTTVGFLRLHRQREHWLPSGRLTGCSAEMKQPLHRYFVIDLAFIYMEKRKMRYSIVAYCLMFNQTGVGSNKDNDAYFPSAKIIPNLLIVYLFKIVMHCYLDY